MKKTPTIITLLSIRPDIIRMFKLIDLLDKGQEEHGYKHILCHTGQHFDYELDGVFYKELGVRQPDWNMGVGKTLKERGGPTTYVHQLALMFEKTNEMLELFKPDMVVYLGDINGVLTSIVVSRSNVPVIHVEAGGRSFDWRMPEEKCRTIIDHLSDANYCYTERHVQNLISEGIPANRITRIGNIIYDSLENFLPKAEASNILKELNLEAKTYILTTIHREENTTDKDILAAKIQDLMRLAEEMPVILPLMPRVRNNLNTFGLLETLEASKVTITKPLGYFDFLKLQQNAKLIVTDSGTVQEEACILGVPALVCRRSTERPETVKVKATILAENDLYTNAKRALELEDGWDKQVMNPDGGSPSEKVYNDLMEKIKSGYFETVRDRDSLPKIQRVNEAYGDFTQ